MPVNGCYISLAPVSPSNGGHPSLSLCWHHRVVAISVRFLLFCHLFAAGSIVPLQPWLTTHSFAYPLSLRLVLSFRLCCYPRVLGTIPILCQSNLDSRLSKTWRPRLGPRTSVTRRSRHRLPRLLHPTIAIPIWYVHRYWMWLSS